MECTPKDAQDSFFMIRRPEQTGIQCKEEDTQKFVLTKPRSLWKSTTNGLCLTIYCVLGSLKPTPMWHTATQLSQFASALTKAMSKPCLAWKEMEQQSTKFNVKCQADTSSSMKEVDESAIFPFTRSIRQKCICVCTWKMVSVSTSQRAHSMRVPTSWQRWHCLHSSYSVNKTTSLKPCFLGKHQENWSSIVFKMQLCVIIPVQERGMQLTVSVWCIQTISNATCNDDCCIIWLVWLCWNRSELVMAKNMQYSAITLKCTACLKIVDMVISRYSKLFRLTYPQGNENSWTIFLTTYGLSKLKQLWVSHKQSLSVDILMQVRS
jgi:hypothetical protein